MLLLVHDSYYAQAKVDSKQCTFFRHYSTGP